MPTSADHTEIYRGVKIYIAGDYIDRLQAIRVNAVQEARDEVDYELERMKEDQ